MKNKSFIKKLLVLLVVLITSVSQAWAWYTISGAKIYYDDSNSKWNSEVVIALEKWENWANNDGHGCSVFSMSHIDHTKLWYWSGTWGDGGVNLIRFGSSGTTYDWYGWWSSGGTTVDDSYDLAVRDSWAGYSGIWQGSIQSASKMFSAGSTSKGASLTKTDLSGYSALNYSQTVEKWTSTDNGSSYSKQSVNSGTVTISAYKMTGDGTASNSSNSGTINTAATTSVSKDAAYTGEVKLTATENTGYTFMGWYDDSNNLITTDNPYTYNAPKSTKTIRARFRNTTYSLAGENWSSEDISWTESTTQLMSTADGVTYSVTIEDETTGGSTRAFKLLKNQSYDNVIAANTAGVTSTCYNGTLGNSGSSYYNFTLIPYLSGDITISYNTSTKALTVTCEPPVMTFSKDGGNGGSDSQKTYSGMTTSNISAPSKSGYAFQGYWTDDATPIQVINSSGAWIANKTGYTQNTSPVKWATGLNANHDFTAHWNANDYTITLDNQSATTAGTTKVIATFDASTNLTSAITKPTKTGYIFGGYYTGTGGSGTQIIGADGYFIASAGGGSTYTDANKKWKYANNITLKAYWIAITVSATISPSTGATGASKDFTFSITSNVGTSDGYDVAVYSFGTVGSGEPSTASYLNGTVSYNASPKSYTASSIGGFSTAGNYTTKAVVLKGGTVQATSVAITYSAGDYYTVSFDMQGHGSDIASQNILSGSTATEPSPAPTATGYTFGGWYQEPACTNAYNFSTSVTANKTLYAKWTANNYTVTFNKQSGSGGDNSVSATYDADMPSATMPTRTGYTFGGYYTAVDGGGTKYYNADGTSARTWNLTAATTLYAQWTERTVTVSPTNSYDHGNPSYSNPTATNSGTIGIASTSTLTAPAAGTGYTFAGWTLSDNIYVTSGTPATDRIITIRHKTGDGSAVTATAKYNEVLTSDWHIIGTPTSIFHGSSAWGTDGDNMLRKASGSSTASAGSVTINVTALGAADNSYQFKVKNASTTTVYGWSNESYYYMNAAATKTTNVYSGQDHALYFIPDALGNYVFSVDWSGTYPSLTVTWPTSYAIQYSKGTINGSTGNITAKYNTVAFSSNTKIQSGQTITLIAPDEKEGYTWAGWFNNNAGSGDALSMNKTYTPTVSAAMTYYACYTINNHAITHSDASHGNYTIKVGSAAAVSTNTTSNYGETITLAASPSTGYHLGSWTVTKSPSGSVTVTSNQFTMPDADVTVAASFTANTYRVQFHRNGGAGDVVYQNFTYDAAQNLTANTYTRTGYNFAGWAESAGGSKVYDDEDEVSNLTSTAGATFDLYAKWTPMSCTVNFNFDESDAGYGSKTGATTSVTATYDAAMTSVTPPAAKNGYAFMGFYDDVDGAGTQYYDGTGASARTWNKDTEDDVTLYAYYKKAELTALVLSPSTQAPEETVTATPTISPTPTGTVKLCWKILRANGNLYTDTGFTDGEGNAVSFAAPSASGSYKVKCVLRTGSDCAGGTALDSILADLVVAGEHTVTVRYQDSDGRTLAASTEVTGKPLEWTKTTIDAPTITGYTFHHWAAGDGVTLSKNGSSAHDKDTAQVANIYIKASYEGTLTAVYNKRRMVYFNNTLGWSSVYVYFYSDATAWDDSDNGQGTSSKRGSGAKTDKIYNGSTYPYSAGHHGEMQNIAGTNIWYFDMATAGYSDCANITFSKDDQHGYEYFSNTEIARVTNAPYNSTTLPMYVPIPGVKEEHNKLSDGKKAIYYTKGYWMNYPNNTGYWLKIFDKVSGTPTPVCIQDIPFEYTGDMTMPMTVTAELDEGVTYGFKIYRSDAVWFGNTGTMKSGASGDTGETAWEFTTGASSNCGLKTSIAGEYKFTLNYAPKSGTYYYLVGVHYPVAANDYRIVYKDRATWSQGSAHSASWYHPSRAIHKENGAEDIVSFYVSKAVGASASMKFQKASSISNEGVVTWADSTGGTIDISGITKSGVYNFYLTQADGVISVSKIEPYEGNYYIRTDCAGSTKWDNYRAKDHQMTYTEFSKNPSTNQFGDLYTHYYMHWCPRETNVKFVIANDYSMCITDTLTEDVGEPYSNITSGGYLKSQKNEGKTEEQDIYSANIRFMYNDSTNRITRAYMSSSTEAARKFLVLRSNTKFTDDGKTLNGTGEVSDDVNHIYEAIFLDDQDWIYERKVKVKPGSKFKLYASYAQATAQEEGSQHFRGAYEDNDWSTAANYVELIGGTGDSCIVRVVYDFKTNRLMSAYVPSEEAISGEMAINADIMLVRDHQEAGQQLTFATAASALTNVKTVYGVMRFNRWILNNRQNPEDHDKEHSKTPALINEHHPLIDNPGDLKSSSERGLYWISFPFDVRLSEVFGFGTYGTDWVFMGYNGAERARSGYWKDSEGFWEYIWDRQDTILAAGHGIVLALDLDRMGAANTSFWKNEIQQVELFFPSMSSTTGTIKQTDAEVTLASHQCSIDRRTDKSVADINKDRRIADSHWNLLGVPSYANYDEELTDGSSDITWNSNPKTQDLPFLYEWNANDNSYTVQSGTTYPFKAMHAYFVQYQGKVHWTLASATPASIVARRTYAERPQNVELRLELSRNEKMIDQTFVKLSNDEEASANFIFGEDMNKEFNSGKANVYTLIENYIPAAGNTLPMSEQTTIIPVGVKLATSGDYTFAIPDGTEGIGVTLIDNETGVRTSLSALDYTINLSAGTYNDRFVLEISPIQQMPTGVEEVTGDGLQVTGARKVLIDGLLYIVKDGKMFDARGAVVK